MTVWETGEQMPIIGGWEEASSLRCGAQLVEAGPRGRLLGPVGGAHGLGVGGKGLDSMPVSQQRQVWGEVGGIGLGGCAPSVAGTSKRFVGSYRRQQSV